MLDSIFRNPGDRKQEHDEMKALIFQARSERNALKALLEQAGGTVEKLARTDKALDALGTKAEGAMQKVDKFAGLAATFDERARGFENLDARVAELLLQVSEAKRVAQAFTATDGEMRAKQLHAMDELDLRAREAQDGVRALRQEQERLDGLRSMLRESTSEIELAVRSVATLKSDFESLRSSESELRQQMQAVQDVAHEAHGSSLSASSTVKDIETRLESLAQVQELSKGTEKRLAALNALAEHVSHKAKALETQKHTVEHAVVEATRLNEMVWTMDAQIAKLTDGRDQMQRAEETVTRMEQLARATTQELTAATTAREEFLRESARLETQGRTLADYLRSTIERLSIDRSELDAFDQRMKSLSAAVGETESRVQDVLGKNEALSAMQQKGESLAKTFTALRLETEDLARKQSILDTLAEQLGEVDALGKRTAAQHESLMQSQEDLDAARLELEEFHRAHAEAVQLRDKLALDRATLESYAERTTTMLSRTPDVEARLDSVLSKLSLVEEGGKSAARLGEVAAELDTQLTRVSARLQFVERLDERVNGLHVLTSDVERKLAEQLARRAEVESLKSLCDTLSTQVADAQQKLDGVSALQGRLLPVTTQVTALMQTLATSQQLVASVKRDESLVQEQHARFAELVELGKKQATETAERMKQVQAVSDDLGRAAAMKEEVLAELARVQARQRDAVSQIDVAEDQLKRAEATIKQLEQRRAQLLSTEKTIAAFEARLGDLDRSAETVDQKIKSLAEREALVQAVKAEVDNIRQISSRSRADLQFVTDHRTDVADIRAKVEGLLARVGETDDKIAMIESRRKVVEEVQARASDITHMLDDIHVNLEMLGEQRAVIDHVGEKLARLDFTVQEAQNTLRALQREREMAERIEQGIKALRARSGTGQSS